MSMDLSCVRTFAGRLLSVTITSILSTGAMKAKLRRVPCLYLLDARKRVLCKGAVTAEQIAGALEKALSR